MDVKHLVLKRSLEELQKVLLKPAFGLMKSDLNIGVWTTTESVIPTVLVNHSVLSESETGVDPFELGKARVYPIDRWYDMIYGYNQHKFISERPVVRIRRL